MNFVVGVESVQPMDDIHQVHCQGTVGVGVHGKGAVGAAAEIKAGPVWKCLGAVVNDVQFLGIKLDLFVKLLFFWQIKNIIE